MIREVMWSLRYIRYRLKSKKGSPLVEESIILGLALFAFMILASIVFDLIEFARNIFEDVTSGLDKLPGG